MASLSRANDGCPETRLKEGTGEREATIRSALLDAESGFTSFTPMNDIFAHFQDQINDEYIRIQRRTELLELENAVLRLKAEGTANTTMSDMVDSVRSELIVGISDDDTNTVVIEIQPTKDSGMQKRASRVETVLDEVKCRKPEPWSQALFRKARKPLRKLLGQPQVLRSDTSPPLVATPAFEVIAACAIILNSVAIAVETDLMASRAQPIRALDYIGLFFNLFFLGELILRVMTFGRGIFTGDDSPWNLFDAFIVTAGLVDSGFTFTGGDSTSFSVGGLKAMKILRIMRLFRVFRFFRQLSMLAHMVIASLASLLWASVMFFLIVFVFSLTLTSFNSDWLKQQATPSGSDWQQDLEALGRDEVTQVYLFFGNLTRSIYTLIQLALNGLEWGSVTTVLLDHVGVFPGMLVLAYVLFTVIAMLNVFTGVFVETALESAKSQRQVQLEDEMERQHELLKEIGELFGKLDQDQNSGISREEADLLFEEPILCAYLSHIGFDQKDGGKLFTLFAQNDLDEVTLDQFVDGCLAMRGPAKALDLHLLAAELKDLLVKLIDATTMRTT